MILEKLSKKPLSVGKYLKTSEADNLIRNYKQERWVNNSEKIGKEDSLSLWWSIEEMEQFIAKAKDNNADGLKFYFGAYGKDYEEKPEYAERQTLVMVATKKNKTEKGIRNKDVYINTSKGAKILAYNQGKMCPPNCGNGNGFDLDELELGITILDRGDKGFIVI